MRETLAARLRAARAETGISQVQLGDRIGAPQGNISRCEDGVRTPALKRLVTLADELRVSSDWLTRREEWAGR